jgi:hypothetical protein
MVWWWHVASTMILPATFSPAHCPLFLSLSYPRLLFLMFLSTMGFC